METTTGDYDALAALVAERAPAATELPEIGAHAGQDQHAVWLDAPAGQVWHAWADLDDPTLWHLDSEPARQAQAWITETLTLALDRLAAPGHPDSYADRPQRAEEDLDALAELERVQLAELRAAGASPADIDEVIRGRMDALRAQIAREGALRSRALREAFGDERGAAARVAEALGVQHETARRALAAGPAYTAKVRREAQEAARLEALNG